MPKHPHKTRNSQDSHAKSDPFAALIAGDAYGDEGALRFGRWQPKLTGIAF
jgi:hypothetical protein